MYQVKKRADIFLGSTTFRKTLFRKVICELQLSSVLWLKQLTHYQIQDVNVMKQKTRQRIMVSKFYQLFLHLAF